LKDVGTETVDVYISALTLNNVTDQNLMLQEAKRVLKPGGTILISCPNKTANFSCTPALDVM